MLVGLPSRLAEKIQPQGDCWIWQGAPTANGYGRFSERAELGKILTQYAHRLIYEILVGPISEGLHIDHLCRNRMCVNPAHLEPVTCRENILRGISPIAQQARQTHCKRGHEFTAENTRVSARGSRTCITCKAQARHRRYVETGK
jgi:hypothetical protein